MVYVFSAGNDGNGQFNGRGGASGYSERDREECHHHNESLRYLTNEDHGLHGW